MKMPKKIRIGSTIFDVKIIPNLADGSTRLDGHIVYGPSEIRIESSFGRQRKQIILWHEIIHALLDQSAAELGDNTERVCEIVSHGIVSVLRDNEYLRGEK